MFSVFLRTTELMTKPLHVPLCCAATKVMMVLGNVSGQTQLKVGTYPAPYSAQNLSHLQCIFCSIFCSKSTTWTLMFVVSLLGKIESATTKATCLVFPCVALKITCLIGSVLNHNAKIQAPYFGSFFCSKFWRSRRGFCSSSIDFSLSQIRKDAPNVSVGSSDDLCTVASLLLKRYNTTCMSC